MDLLAHSLHSPTLDIILQSEQKLKLRVWRSSETFSRLAQNKAPVSLAEPFCYSGATIALHALDATAF